MLVRIVILVTGYLWGSLFVSSWNPVETKDNPNKKQLITFIVGSLICLILSGVSCYISYETQVGFSFIPYSVAGTSFGILYPLFGRTRKRGKVMRYLIPALLIIVNLYLTLVNGVLNAALIPEFMRKLDAFEELTVKNYSEQIQTDDIKENAKEAKDETELWYKSSSHVKYAAKNEEGYKLVATFFPSNQNATFDDLGQMKLPSGEELTSKWAVILHGYTGWKESMYEFARYYVMQGYNVLVPDLRCQGESEGDFIGMGATDAIDVNEVWIDYIIKKDPNAQIVLHGQSMGATTALIMSGSGTLPANVKAVISDAAYTDAYSMFADKAYSWFHLPPFPLVNTAEAMLFLRGGYQLSEASAIKAVAYSKIPTLFIHGKEDAMISVSMCEELYDRAGCEKEILIIEGAGHAQNQDKDPELFYGTITAFLNKYITEE